MQEPTVPMLPKEEAARRAHNSGMQERFADLSVFRILLNHPPLAQEIANTPVSYTHLTLPTNREV